MSDDPNLHELLSRLHERLEKAGTIDQDSRALLATVTRDIEKTLGAGEQGASAKAAENIPRLEAFAVQLESEHPKLAQVLRELVGLLAGAGI